MAVTNNEKLMFLFIFMLSFMSQAMTSPIVYLGNSSVCAVKDYQQCPTLLNCTLASVTSCSNKTGIFHFCAPVGCMGGPICGLLKSSVNASELEYGVFNISCPEEMPLDWKWVPDHHCDCAEFPTRSLFLRLVPILVLAVVVIFLIKPVKIPLMPRRVSYKCKIKHIPLLPLDYSTVPVLGVLIILASGALTWQETLQGITGNGRIIPYAVVIMFFSLVYICISLEVTGIFDYISVRTINATKGSGTKLFFSIFALSTILTLSTSNDIAILTLTPIICSLSQYTGAQVTPFLFLQFFMANIWSSTLIIGNPTNIIVSTAYEVSFLQYSERMALPAFFAALTCLLCVWLRFRSQLPTTIKMPEQNANQCWKDKSGAVYGLVCLFTCLSLLLSSTWLPGIPMWAITLGFAFLMFLKDISYDFLPRVCNNYRGYNVMNEKVSLRKSQIEEGDIDEEKESAPGFVSTPQPQGLKQYQSIQVISRLPWKIIFFVFSVFITVEALQVADWTAEIADLLTSAIGTEDKDSNVVIAVYLMGTIAIVFCNILNNQPMTILFTTVLQEDAFAVGPKAENGAMFALILGSNLGANFTLVGALAGIMWASILESKDQAVSAIQFIKIGFTIMPFVFAVACGVLCVELLYF